MRIEVNPQHPEPRKIQRAVELLSKGEVIAYPTDTVYGIGCGLGHKRAVDRIFHLTGKDESQPLTFVCTDLSDIAKYAVVENTPGKLNMQIWDFTWEPGAKYVPNTSAETPNAKKH